MASPFCRNFSTQIGVRIATTAVSARWFASLLAVLVVIQPPQVNPTIATRIAPPNAPQRAGLVSEGSCIAVAFQKRESLAAWPVDVPDARAPTGPAQNFVEKMLCLPTAPTLLISERRLRYVCVLW